MKSLQPVIGEFETVEHGPMAFSSESLDITTGSPTAKVQRVRCRAANIECSKGFDALDRRVCDPSY